MQLEDLDFDLPKELIALYPKTKRPIKVACNGKNIKLLNSLRFNILSSNDALILNDTKVIYADLEGKIKKNHINLTNSKIIKEYLECIYKKISMF